MRPLMTAIQHFRRALELDELARREQRLGELDLAAFYGREMLRHFEIAARMEKGSGE